MGLGSSDWSESATLVSRPSGAQKSPRLTVLGYYTAWSFNDVLSPHFPCRRLPILMESVIAGAESGEEGDIRPPDTISSCIP